jgi:FAD/FMN-containing dehydrogenase
MTHKNIQALAERCADLELTTESAVLASHGQDWTRFRAPSPAAVAFPRNAGQIMQLVKSARKLGLSLVPSGGRTGLSGGAVAANGEVVVALERMRRILDFDPVGRLLSVEAGVVVAAIQEHARHLGLYYPVSFAAEGSAQIGGSIATNAGGIRVLRHGLTRDRVAGLKVVDGRGRLLELNRGLVKNASGYDLRHLLIGSEGTLGIIVEATLGLVASPPPSRVMLLGVESMSAILEMLPELHGRLRLSACEFFSAAALDLVCRSQTLASPLTAPHPYYLLIEFDAPEPEAGQVEQDSLELFDAFVKRGWVLDGVLSQSEAQAAELWAYREAIAASAAPHTPYKNDLSVRLSAMPEFLRALQDLVGALFPDYEVLWYGHVGDGNLHMNILKPDTIETSAFEAICKRASEDIYALTQAFGGSVSAEHGIGLLKRPFLAYSRSTAEIEMMRGIKQVFDPDGILNPGKLI